MKISKLKRLLLATLCLSLTYVVLSSVIQCMQVPERNDDFEVVVKRGYYNFLDKVGSEIGSKLNEAPIETGQAAPIVKNSEPGVQQAKIINKAEGESIQSKASVASHIPLMQQKEGQVQAQELPKSEGVSRACSCKCEATLNTLHELMGSMLEFNSKIVEDKEKASAVLKNQFEFYKRVIGKQHLIDIQQREAAAKEKIEQACKGGYFDLNNPNMNNPYAEKPFVSKEELSAFKHLNIEELANLAVCMRDIGSAIHHTIPLIEKELEQHKGMKAFAVHEGGNNRDRIEAAERGEAAVKLRIKNCIAGILEKMRKYRLLAGKEHPRWDEFLKKSTS